MVGNIPPKWYGILLEVFVKKIVGELQGCIPP